MLAALDARDSRRYAAPMAYFRDLDKRMGYGPALAPYAGKSTLDLWQRYFDEAPGAVAGAAWADLNTYLPDDILVKLDVAAMAHGLEARCPFLDLDLVREVAALPASVRMKAGALKGLMKEALAPLVPAEILARPKMGFGLPIQEWLQGPLAGLVEDTILSPRFAARGLVRPEFVRRMVAEHRAGRMFHHPRLWALLVLELWHRSWIDPAAPPSAPRREAAAAPARLAVVSPSAP
jgi:asparagine synthase (glutamine-hydrolysing)